jgi:hypothetical protein
LKPTKKGQKYWKTFWTKKWKDTNFGYRTHMKALIFFKKVSKEASETLNKLRIYR